MSDPVRPIDGSPPGSPIPGILQARTLEWVTISFSNAYMHAKSLHSCLTLCDPMYSSPPGSSVHGILQTRALEWGVIAFSEPIPYYRIFSFQSMKKSYDKHSCIFYFACAVSLFVPKKLCP